MTFIPDVWGDRRVQGALGGAVLVGLGAGMGIGYILAKRKYSKRKYIVNLVDEMKKGDVNQLSLAFNPDGIGYSMTVADEETESGTIPVEEEAETVRVNVFTQVDDDWDYDVEVAARTKHAPYVIHQEEFVADEMDYRQETLTYYAGDDIMADPADTPIYGYANLLGELKFGHGSKDPSVVYIRNDAIHMEWEVLLHKGLYSVEVMGLTMEQDAEEEIRHSHTVLKFRGD